MFVIFASAAPYNVHFPVWISALAAFMAVGGLASLGINAKDSSVTGGTVVQPGIPVAPVPPATAPAPAVAEAEPKNVLSGTGAPPAKW